MGSLFRDRQMCFGCLLITSAVVWLHAAHPTLSQGSDNMVRELVAWIVSHSDLKLAPLPEVRFLDPGHIASLADSGKFGQAKALYAIESRTVFLLEGWDAQSLKDKSILLHELVHHLQIFNQVPRTCIAQLNTLAYDLQTSWLNQQGVEDAAKYLGINDAMIFQLSTCPDPFGDLPWQ